MSNSKIDAGIPVLTEIIPAPVHDNATDIHPPLPAFLSATKHDVTPHGALPGLAMKPEDMHRLETDISERVLQHILGRIDFVLEQRVRDSLADVLQIAVTSLSGEIRRGLEHTLADMIVHAVSQEIAQLQTQKK